MMSTQPAAGLVEQEPFCHHSTCQRQPFCHHWLARRGGRVATRVGWNDSDVTPTNCGLGRAETFLSPPALSRATDTSSHVEVTMLPPLLVEVTAMSPQPAADNNLVTTQPVKGRTFGHHQITRRGCVATSVGWSDNNVTTTSCGLSWVTTVLSPPDLSRGNRFVTTRLARRGGRIVTLVGWSDSDVTTTSCGLSQATTILSPPDLVHRGGRVVAPVVWVTVMLPLPARRWIQGGWG